MRYSNFTYQGTVYDLSHLHPFDWHYTAEAGDKRPERTYQFHVVFGLHCFSRDPRPGETPDPDIFYETDKELRIFCFDRYQYSLGLPDIVKSLGDRVCWHTHHGNFFTIELMNEKGEQIEYEVYFDVTRASQKGWLFLTIQSAYARSDGYASSQPKKRKISFDVIAYKRQSKKNINAGK